MPIVESEFAPLCNPRLAALATSAWPAWLWSADATRMLWANPVGAAMFGAANTSEAGKLRFTAKDLAASQITRLVATLPTAPQERLERLRGFGGGFGRSLTCACSRIVLSGGAPAVLVAAAEPAGPALTLSDRVHRLFADGALTVAVFAPDGTLLHATAAARKRLDGTTTLSALGIGQTVAQALEAGSASGSSSFGPVDVERLGKDVSRVLVLSFSPRPDEAPAAPAIPEASTPAAAITMPVIISAEPPPPSPPQAPELRTASHDEPMTERRHPLRFVWQMDADARFVVGSDEFIELVGPRTTAAFGRLWSEVAADLKLDPDNLVARAVATRETWSGIVIQWPVDELAERLPIELSGLPVFDRDRSYRGYRGFGVCRDIVRINQLRRARWERPIGFMPVPETPHQADTAAMPPQAAAAGTIAAADAAPDATEAMEPAVVTAAATETATRAERAPLSLAPGSANVVPFRPGPSPEPKAPSLSPVERKAFRELAQELTARLRGTPGAGESAFEEPPGQDQDVHGEVTVPVERAEAGEFVAGAAALAIPASPGATPPETAATAQPDAANVSPVADEAHPQSGNAGSQGESAPGVAGTIEAAPQPVPVLEQVLLERIPTGILVFRHDPDRKDLLLYANRHFLDWSGYENLDALAAAGGLNSLFVEPGAGALTGIDGTQPLSIKTQRGDQPPVEGRLFMVPWNGASALALMLTGGQTEERHRATARALGAAESENRELRSILEAATDGVVVLDRDGRVIGSDAGAGALFGMAADEFKGRSLTDMLAPESERAARDYLDRIVRGTNMLHDALDVEAPDSDGRRIPLAMTLAPIGGDRIGAVFRDGTARGKIDEELRTAKREAQKAAAAKAEFLAKVSHEIRTPLNAMTGFAEVIIAERFGPIGNERYREYLKDIHAAGTHLVSLLNDLLDLSKVETGQLDLTFANVNLNGLTQQCVGIMQPQASRARIIIRTSLTHGLPQVLADERSLRQIVLNLLSNSIKFTGPGGQVIVSTAFTDDGEAVLRVRDTGVGMSEKDVEATMEPFRQTATSGSWGSGGTGLGLPLTKALAEANRANFSIKSAPNAGTLVEIAFPPTRVVGGIRH